MNRPKHNERKLSTLPTMILLVYGLGTLVFFKGLMKSLPDLAGALVGVSSIVCAIINLLNDRDRLATSVGGRVVRRGVFRHVLLILSFVPTGFFVVCTQLFLGNVLFSREGVPGIALATFAGFSLVCFFINDSNDRMRRDAMKGLPPPLPPRNDR